MLGIQVFRISPGPPREDLNSIDCAELNELPYSSLSMVQGNETCIVVEPFIRLAEGVHDNGSIIGSKALGFQQGGYKTMEQLIANVANLQIFKAKLLPKEIQTFSLAWGEVLGPFTDCVIERLGYLSFNRNRNETAVFRPRQSEDIVLGWMTLCRREVDFVLRNS